MQVNQSPTNNTSQLYKRKIFDEIEPYIGDETVVVLHGARQVGKTHILYWIQNWLLERNKKSFYYDLDFTDLLNLLNQGIDVFIHDLADNGYVTGEEVYVLIDEIQYLDNPSSFLKIIADHYKNIHLIVSGSSTFDIKTKFKDSLAGRTTPFEIFPLDFSEYLTFKQSEYKDISNLGEFAIKNILKSYCDFIKFGGYPKVVLETDEKKKKKYLFQLIDTYIRKDIRDLAEIGDIKKFNSMLVVLASQSGQLLSMQSLSRETGISFEALQKYINILEETYVIKLISPYSKSRSVEISKNPKVFFYDSGLLSILWLNNFQETIIGLVFETNVFGELVKKYGRNNINFWRTKTGQEIDFVVKKDNLELIPIEVKTNFGQFGKRAMNTFRKKYITKNWAVVGIDGEKINENYLYPWEI